MIIGFSIALVVVGIIAIAATGFIFCTKVVIEEGQRKRKFAFCHRCRKEKIADINLQSQPGSILVPHLRVGQDGLVYQVQPPANVHMLVNSSDVSPDRNALDLSPPPYSEANQQYSIQIDDSQKGQYPVVFNNNALFAKS